MKSVLEQKIDKLHKNNTSFQIEEAVKERIKNHQWYSYSTIRELWYMALGCNGGEDGNSTLRETYYPGQPDEYFIYKIYQIALEYAKMSKTLRRLQDNIEQEEQRQKQDWLRSINGN